MVRGAASISFPLLSLRTHRKWKVIMKRVLAATGRASFVVFALAFLIGISAALQTYTSVTIIIPDVRSGSGLGFASLCP